MASALSYWTDRILCVLLVCVAFLFLNFYLTSFIFLAEASNVHIVYMGARHHEDSTTVESSHHEVLTTLLGSKEAAQDSILYSYKHGFSGFAAKLTKSQADRVAEFPGIIQVIPNRVRKLHTTRSWDFIGLHRSSGRSLLSESRMGREMIIGVIDSGIWPESESFNDRGMGPVPSRWKGACEHGELFNFTNCNKKLIGARWFGKGLIAEKERPIKTAAPSEYLSPRDATGHGTHTASTAAGRLIKNASYRGLAAGTARGGAPFARLAVYKACWDTHPGECSDADILKAFDEAIHDGVDVISVSLGNHVPLLSYVEDDSISIGSFHAAARGISVVCSAGNDGPFSQTVTNTAPWVTTVAAASIDRAFPTAIILGNNHTVLVLKMNSAYNILIRQLKVSGHRRSELQHLLAKRLANQRVSTFQRATRNRSSAYQIQKTWKNWKTKKPLISHILFHKSVQGQTLNTRGYKGGFHELRYSEFVKKEKADAEYSRSCYIGTLNATLAKGKVILCFSSLAEDAYISEAAQSVSRAGGIGLIFAQTQDSELDPCDGVPCIKVNYEVGTQILSYIRQAKFPVVKLSHPKTLTGRLASPRIAHFSSRGPSSLSPAFLKPDIAAPGVSILAAHRNPADADDAFAFMSGTSMACPHVTGIVALIKSIHRDWSPAAIRSALVTTATQTGTDGGLIVAQDGSRKPADPFDYGGGHVDPNRAADPGLVYNMSTIDYVPFLCSLSYNDPAISNLMDQQITCPITTSELDLNLPSIVIPNLKGTATISRTMTNVGPANSVYEALVHPPRGIKMQVMPLILEFNSTTTSISFTVTFASPSRKVHSDYRFGSLTWTDGVHVVRSPVAVRAILFDSYSDM
ncbi:subtilisin-like protease SBT3.9 [Phoenix dactylifera]|uniref:Subtilisin-like protease SBT3.9 n=1 Tax=Phoenix dactylifera TaxID=42345 RepID=A0A8B9A9J2_PHODC|nr:subtilisin-like protease SBT3.9 [Phoenix dactylifera]